MVTTILFVLVIIIYGIVVTKKTGRLILTNLAFIMPTIIATVPISIEENNHLFSSNIIVSTSTIIGTLVIQTAIYVIGFSMLKIPATAITKFIMHNANKEE